MIIFIGLNLAIAFLLQSTGILQMPLIADMMMYVGVTLLISCFIATISNVKKIPFKLRYDLFAVAALLVWLSYWPDSFRDGSPIFKYYPLYFAFISAFFSLLFITKRDQMDDDAIIFLQWLSDSGRFNPILIMLAVMISLALPKHFMLFPLAISLWVLRFTLASCLNNE